MRLSLLLAIGLVLAACGSSAATESNGVASLEEASDSSSDNPANPDNPEPVDAEEAMMNFAECMQDLGVDIDITVGPDGNPGIAMQRGDGDGPGGFELSEQCRHHLDGVTTEFSAADQTEMMDQVLEFIGCIRDQGIDMPDPSTSGGGGFTFQPPENATQAEFMAAIEACDEFRPQGGNQAVGAGGN